MRHGNVEAARQLKAEAAKPESPYHTLHLDELQGLLEIADGRADAGIATLRLAAEAEDALPYTFGPPRVFKPTFELLGEELLRLGRRDESEAAYRRANERNPGRTLSVRGLAQARALQSATSQ